MVLTEMDINFAVRTNAERVSMQEYCMSVNEQRFVKWLYSGSDGHKWPLEWIVWWHRYQPSNVSKWDKSDDKIDITSNIGTNNFVLAMCMKHSLRVCVALTIIHHFAHAKITYLIYINISFYASWVTLLIWNISSKHDFVCPFNVLYIVMAYSYVWCNRG